MNIPPDTVIPLEVHQYGCTLTQIKRTGRALLYEARSPEGQPRGYEVMVARLKKPSLLRGAWMAGGESLPSPSTWGVFGWSYLPVELDRAEAKFATVCKRFNKPEVKPVHRIIRRMVPA